MKKYLLILALSIAGISQVQNAVAQRTNIMSAGVRTDRYGKSDVEGSPFLSDEWIPGTATSDKGEVYQVKLKYDMALDQPVFADSAGGVMTFAIPITRFTLNNDVYQKGFPAVDQWKESAFYKTIGAGKTKLLKHAYKSKLEKKDVNGLTDGYMYEDNSVYYLLKDGKMTKIKPNKGAILSALSDKKEQVEAYVKTNKVDFKQDADLAKLMDYYNSI